MPSSTVFIICISIYIILILTKINRCDAVIYNNIELCIKFDAPFDYHWHSVLCMFSCPEWQGIFILFKMDCSSLHTYIHNPPPTHTHLAYLF